MNKYLFLIVATVFYLFNIQSAFGQTCLWAKGAGGGSESRSVATDAFGNVYITGTFGSAITFGTTTLINTSRSDIFLVKYNSSGSVIWARSAGGSVGDSGLSKCVATDAMGNVYITGAFSSPTFTFGTTTLTNAGWLNIFLVKYNSSGSIIWAQNAGGSIDDEAMSVTTDASGSVYIAGYFSSPTITFGTTTLTNEGGYDIFLVKYDASGSVIWGNSVGGIGEDHAASVATDASGNVYVTGYFASDTITFGTTTLTNAGNHDIFLVKYGTSGSVIWAKSAGGRNLDDATSVTTDASGNVYITGYFTSDTITFGTTTLRIAGLDNVLLAKYNSSGSVVWAKSAALATGIFPDIAQSVATDASGNVYITGMFSGGTIAFDTSVLTNSGYLNLFLVKYSALGSVIWAKSAGGSAEDYASSVATDASGCLYITGMFTSPTITFGTTTLTSVTTAFGENMFLAKYSASTGASVTKLIIDNDMAIYPNPAIDVITLTIDKPEDISAIQIFDMMGKEVYQDFNLKTKIFTNQSVTIKLPLLSAGIYDLRVLGSNGTEQKQFVVNAH